MTRPDPEQPPQAGWRRRNLRVSSVLWGAAVWVALWGDVSVGNVLAGALLGLTVALVFPLPPLPTLRPRPLAMLRLLAVFLRDLVVASAQVIRVILAPGAPRSSVIAVCMRSDSDLVTTIVGELHSLVPGSIMVDIRRSDHTLYLHVLDTPDDEAVRAVRERAFVLEALVLAALGMDVPPHPPQEQTVAERGGA